MANPGKASGAVRERNGRLYIRITIAPKKRETVFLSWCSSPEVALKRAALVQALVTRLRAAGHDELVPKVLEAASSADPAKVEAIARAVDGLLGGQLAVTKGAPAPLTFQAFAERWTSGALHREFPDFVRSKRSAEDDVFRLAKHVYPLIGARALASITLDDALGVMRKLPPELASGSRRHVAQLLSKIFTTAVYPCRVLPASPLPRGFLPKLRKQKGKTALYPDEEAALLACTNIPLVNRVLYGFSAREGMRSSESLRMTWGDLDLVRGAVRLDKNKSDLPRCWALDPTAAEALRRWRTLSGGASNARVFPGVENNGHLAGVFRMHLKEAGVARSELYEDSDVRRPIRFHDLRGTFCSVALACDKTEAWVTARTGWRSSMQVAAYRRLAQQFSDVGAGWFEDMAATIPELANISVHGGPDGGPRRLAGHRRASSASKSPRKTVVVRENPSLGSAAERHEGSSPFPCTSETLRDPS